MKRHFVLALLMLSFFSCTFPKPKATIYLDIDDAMVALVLGEGIARSYAHAGVVKALEEAEIPIHMVVGTGMGSFMGALYANKRRANDMEWHAMAFKADDYFDPSLLGTGLISGERVRNFLMKRLIHSQVEKFPIPFYAVSTDLKSGRSFVFEKGPVLEAVNASLAIPGIFDPIAYDQKLLVSGEISQGIPVHVAEEKGVDLIIAVDLTQGIDQYRFKKTRDMAIQSYKITSAALSKEQLKKAHVVIRPNVAHIDVLDFSRKREAFLAGYQAAQEALPQIREIFSLEEE